MLEPLAATAFSTLLSARPFAGQHFATQPALRMVTRATSAAFPQDFFTPRPRRGKGKERALPDDDCNARVSYHTPLPASVSESCKGVRHGSMLRDMSLCRHRPRRIPGRKTMHAPSRSDLPRFHYGLQKRHASSLPEPLGASSSSPSVSPEDQWRHVISHYCSGAMTSDPEEVWRAYESLHQSDGCASLEVAQLLDYGSRIAAAAEKLHHGKYSPEPLRSWGTRLQILLQNLAPRIQDNPVVEASLRWRCLMVCGLAMAGQIDEAISAANVIKTMPTEQHLRQHVVRMYTTIVSSMHQHRDSVPVLRFLIEEWDTIGSYLQGRPLKWKDDQALFHAVETFKKHAYDIVACVENPVAFMLDMEKRWPREQQRLAGEFLIEGLCESQMGNDARDILDIMQQQSLLVKLELQLEVVKALVKADSFELANTLFTALSRYASSGRLSDKYQSVGLYLFAHQGNVERVEEYFNRMSQRSRILPHDITLLLHAHAVAGDLERVVQLFAHFFPAPSTDRPDPPRPTIFHYTTVVYAHARHGDFHGMNRWLEAMIRAGIKPDITVYSMILKSFAERGEMQPMAELLNRMRAAGVPPSGVSYTTVISLLAQRSDVPAAEAVFKRALDEGIVPDRQMVTALMNAYVQSGQWQGVVRAFDYMNSSGRRGIRISLEVYNTLFKAYVMIGAPFRVVASLFQKLEEARVRPDSYTFALLIQSACDSDLLQIASDLYAEMERLAEDWQSDLHINVYVLTIIMSAYLRKGNRGKAKAMFDEMQKRGIQPTATTYAAIVKAYGGDRTGAGLQVAEDFIRTLMGVDPEQRPWMATNGGRRAALETVFAPLMSAYAQRQQPEYVERLIQEMLDAGGERTIGALTALLDAYRRIGNVEAVRKLWPEIQEVGMRYAEVDTLFADKDVQPDLRGHGIVMNIPLSICVDALSAAGLHTEVANIWKSLHDAKLAFDSHNWNHLVIALVRAGEVERAFEVIEKVILPYRRKFREEITMERDTEPGSPLADSNPDEDDLPPTQSESPLHSRDRRVTAVQTATKKLKPSHEEGKPGDFAHTLYVLSRISPLWSTWRPHDLTLRVLHDVLQHLRRGKVVQPIPPYTDTSANVPSTIDVESLQNRAALARRILGRIYHKFPDSVKMVEDYAIVQQSQIRKAKYRRSQ